MIVFALALALYGTDSSCQLAYQLLRPGSLELDIRTTDGQRYRDPLRREADHLVASPDGKDLAVWSDHVAGVLIGLPGRSFRSYQAAVPPPDPRLIPRDKGSSPRVAWCFDGQHALLAFFPDSRVIEKLDLQSGRTSRDDFTNSVRLMPAFESGDSGTSGCKIRVSPDGTLAAVTTASRRYADEVESEHETSTYLISRKGGKAKYLSLGSPVTWLDSHRLLIWHSKGESGDLFVEDVDGKVVATRRRVSLATACANGEIFVATLAYLGGDGGPPKLFQVDINLGGNTPGGRLIPIPGGKWWGMRNDGIAAIKPR